MRFEVFKEDRKTVVVVTLSLSKRIVNVAERRQCLLFAIPFPGVAFIYFLIDFR